MVLKAAGPGIHLSSIVYLAISKMDRNECHRTGMHETESIQSFSNQPSLLAGEDAINYACSSRSAGVDVCICGISVFSCRGPHMTARDVGPMHGLVHGRAMSSPRTRLATIAVFSTEEKLEGALDVLSPS